jgi:hypothetical protein
MSVVGKGSGLLLHQFSTNPLSAEDKQRYVCMVGILHRYVLSCSTLVTFYGYGEQNHDIDQIDQ